MLFFLFLLFLYYLFKLKQIKKVLRLTFHQKQNTLYATFQNSQFLRIFSTLENGKSTPFKKNNIYLVKFRGIYPTMQKTFKDYGKSN